MATTTKTITEEEIDISDIYAGKLIVYNDSINTFEHVINSLVQVCGIKRDKAADFALQIDSKGSAIIQEGDYSEMKEKSDKLNSLQLTTEVQ